MSNHEGITKALEALIDETGLLIKTTGAYNTCQECGKRTRVYRNTEHETGCLVGQALEALQEDV